jgi:nucleoside-diphosphate-sugar epimerase
MIGITGSSGVLGKILCSKLKEHDILFSTFNDDIREDKAVIDWVINDKLTYIIHLASKVAVSEVENNIDLAYDVNISGTINLIKAIKKYNQPLGFFYASTSHVYGSSSKAIKEDDIIKPISSYGLTKWVSELLLNDFAKKHFKMKLCIGRIFSFYHDSQNTPFLYANLMKRFDEEDLSKPFQLYGAHSTRDFLNAEDVCDIIIKLVSKEQEGTINIASGHSISIIDFAKKIAPKEIDFQFDLNESINHLNADISLLNTILKNYE